MQPYVLKISSLHRYLHKYIHVCVDIIYTPTIISLYMYFFVKKILCIKSYTLVYILLENMKKTKNIFYNIL